MNDLALKIKRLREERKLSQAQVAEEVGVSRVAVTKWESGETANLKLSNLVALCRLFGLQAEDLLGDGSRERPAASSASLAETRDASVRQERRSYDARPLIGDIAEVCARMSDDGLKRVYENACFLAEKYPLAAALADPALKQTAA